MYLVDDEVTIHPKSSALPEKDHLWSINVISHFHIKQNTIWGRDSSVWVLFPGIVSQQLIDVSLPGDRLLGRAH